MIKLQSLPAQGLRFKEGPLAVFLLEDDLLGLYSLPKADANRLLKLAEEERATGKPGQIIQATLEGQKVLFVGLGKKAKFDAESLRKACGSLEKSAEALHKALGVLLPAAELALAAAEGLSLASYRYTQYKTAEEPPFLERAALLVPEGGAKAAEQALRKAAIRVEAVCMVRDLVNAGPSDKKPETLAEAAKALEGGPVKVQVFGKKDLEKMGMNAILGVARGSLVEPKFIHLTYKPSKPGGQAGKKVAIVGKGITFDSGGLSLKTPQNMEAMKMDMAGGATVLAVVRAASRLGLAVELHGFVPFTYNLPGGDALKPGDILKAYNGKTIEVLNTDAEGRLVLSDALAYASKMEFDAIIDVATLTGAALVALGSSVTAAMGNNKALWESLRAAGERAGEKIWELPLVPEYKDGIKSKVADLQNISSVRGEAGTIIGGLFLEEFVDSAPWIHLDVAGTAWTEKASSYLSYGGTGNPVRTLLEYLEAL